MGPEDVLPLSVHLHAIAEGWPTRRPSGSPLIELTDAGRILDELRNRANELSYPYDSWFAVLQPVGRLYREEGVIALQSWLKGLRGLLSREMVSQCDQVRTIIDQAVETETPLIRLYEYAAEALDLIVTVVSASKDYVFWNSQLVDYSPNSLVNINHVWTLGQLFDSSTFALVPDSTASQRVRAYERQIREKGEPSETQQQKLDGLLSAEAKLNPDPPAAQIIPSEAAILWRVRRLELVDVERFRRWLQHTIKDPVHRTALQDVISFIDSAGIERANVLLDAFCTDSPDAI